MRNVPSHSWRRLSSPGPSPSASCRVLQRSPLRRHHSLVSTPGHPHRRALPRQRVAATTSLPPLDEEPSDRRRHALALFRLRRFSLPCRFAPPGGSWACCVPQPTLRFTVFRGPPRWLRVRPLPSGATPSRAFPTRTAVRASPRAVALLPLPPASRPAGATRLQGLAPCVCPLSAATVASGADPLLSWASPLWSHEHAVEVARRAPWRRHPVTTPRRVPRRGCAGRWRVLRDDTGARPLHRSSGASVARAPVAIRRAPKDHRADAVSAHHGPVGGPEDASTSPRRPRASVGFA